MQLLLFSIVIICIAGSRTQEITLGTDYIRAHINDTFLPESAMNAQIVDLPPNGLSGGEPSPASSTETSSTTTASTSTAAKIDDDSPEDDNDDSKKFAHDHKTHHEHDATITLDVHNILDLFKQQLHETEERLLAAIHHTDHPASAVPVLKSYRTADR